MQTVEVITYWHQKTYGTPILLSPTAEKFTLGDWTGKLNAMTGSWLLSNRTTREAFFFDSPAAAARHANGGEPVKLVRRKARDGERP